MNNVEYGVLSGVKGSWLKFQRNRFGTNEFIEYACKIGTEPYFSVNMGTGTIEEARRWVEYCKRNRTRSFPINDYEWSHLKNQSEIFYEAQNNNNGVFDFYKK